MSAEDRVETDRKRHAAWAKFAKETGDTPAMPAATVVVLRDGPEGPETLMLRKNSKIAFGGMWVFPGGKVDDEDWDGAGEDVDAARNAAIREAAEEAHLRVEAHEMVVFAHWIPPAIAPLPSPSSRSASPSIRPTPETIGMVVYEFSVIATAVSIEVVAGTQTPR